MAAQIAVTTDKGEQPAVAVPPAPLKLIGQVLGLMSERHPITLMPGKQEFMNV